MLFWLWVRRIVWLAAWGLWLAFGYALYIVVPRAAGTPAAHLELEPKEAILGFIDGEDRIASYDPENSRVRVWGADGGRLIHDWPIVVDNIEGRTRFFSNRHGVLVLSRESALNSRVHTPVIVDVRTGRTRTVRTIFNWNEGCAFHPEHPWMLCNATLFGDLAGVNSPSPSRVVLVDLRTGEIRGCIACEAPPADQWMSFGAARFIPNTDLLAVEELSSDGAKSRRSLRIWKTPPDHDLVRTLPDVGMGADPQFSDNQRVLRSSLAGDRDLIEVFDLRTGTTVLSTSVVRRSGISAEFRIGVALQQLSADGTLLVDVEGDRLIEVDTGRVLRKLPPNSFGGVLVKVNHDFIDTLVMPTDFAVVRGWNQLVASRFPSVTVRRPLYCRWGLRTGRLVEVGDCGFEYVNDKGTLQYSPDTHEVFQYPHRVRWGVIAAVQGTSGALLLGIAVLSAWARRRRRRLESGESS